MSVRAGSVTQRRMPCDVTILTLEGTSVLAYFTDASATFSRELVDVTGPQDTWKLREYCSNDLEFTLSKYLYQDEQLLSIFMDGGSVYVSADIAGKTLYGIFIMENATVNASAPMVESATLRIASGTPTLA